MRLLIWSTALAATCFVFGPRQPKADYDPLILLQNDAADLEIFGATASARTGYAIAAGDYNGDGLADFAVSADGRQPLQGSRKGEYYVFWGGATPSSGSLDLANSPVPTRIFGRADDFPLFCTLATCDLNGDGRDDLFIGTPLYSNSKGRGYLLLGQDSWPDTLDLQQSVSGVVTFTTATPNASLGFAACNVNFNGDGKEDLAISAPGTNYGEINIVLGASALPGSYTLGVPSPGVVRIIDNNLNQFAGGSLSSTDFDRDGRDDLVFGGPGQASGTYSGVVTIVYGIAAPGQTLNLSTYLGKVKRLRGEYSHARLGEKVEAADINSDGRPDLVASAPYADPGGCLDCGEIYLIYEIEQLPASLTTAEVAVPMTRILGTVSRTHYGISIACGDFTADGLADVALAGTSLNSPFPDNRDTVAVAYGDLAAYDQIVVSNEVTLSRIVSQNYSDDLGQGMRVEDLNGDGIDDLIIGAYSWDREGLSSAGKLYVFYGHAVGTGVEASVPSLLLGEPNPNPFGERTQVEYRVGKPTRVEARVYDVRGRVVRTTLSGNTSGSQGDFVWDGRDDKGRRVSAGVYFVRVIAGTQKQTRKVVLVR